MKTRLIALIIIGVVLFGSFSFVYALMYDCLNPPAWIKMPKSDFRYCLGLLVNGHLPDFPTWEEYLASKETKPEPDFNPVPEPEPEPMPEENPETEIIQDEYVSPFDEELIHEFQQYHTVITGKVIEWYGQKEPSKYNYQYRVEPLAHHTPRMQEEFIYKVLGDDFIPVNADVVLFGLDMDDEGNLYIVKTVIQEIPEP